MNKQTCDQTWQVEAARDRRLDASATAGFVQHLRGCVSCQAEQRELDRLAGALVELGGQTDEMALRRLRQRTLGLANEAMMHSESQRPRVRRVAWALVASVALVAAALLVFARRELPGFIASTTVQVEADQGARWQRKLAQNVEEVDLSAGTLLFRVARKPTDPRLLVRVPDGEIEDLGTTFRVSVRDGKTHEIMVSEGRVLFRRRGVAPLQLVAGSTWTAPPEQEAVTPSSKEPSPTGQPQPRSPTLKIRRGESRVRPPKRGEAVPRPEEMDSVKREDEAYLQLLALLREGRTEEARLSALAYLHEFPSGFRRVEVARLAVPRNGDAGASH